MYCKFAYLTKLKMWFPLVEVDSLPALSAFNFFSRSHCLTPLHSSLLTPHSSFLTPHSSFLSHHLFIRKCFLFLFIDSGFFCVFAHTDTYVRLETVEGVAPSSSVSRCRSGPSAAGQCLVVLLPLLLFSLCFSLSFLLFSFSCFCRVQAAAAAAAAALPL